MNERFKFNYFDLFVLVDGPLYLISANILAPLWEYFVEVFMVFECLALWGRLAFMVGSSCNYPITILFDRLCN